MKVCPKCGNLVGLNSYFGAYICEDCGWEDDSYNQERILYYSKRRTTQSFRIIKKNTNYKDVLTKKNNIF